MNLSKYNNKGFVGLENLGNTCFINACMQIINHIYELHEFLDSDTYINHMKKDIPDITIVNEWKELKTVMWSANGIIQPKRFVHNIQRVATKKNIDIFTGFAQNDFPEFLQFFIECIHNSISRSVNININGIPENKLDNLAIKCYKMLKETYSSEYSEIMRMFYGISYSELANKNSKEVLSITPENFFILDLPVINNKNEVANTIYDSLQFYTEAEYLEGDNAWFNDKTNKKEDVSKQMKFWNFPDILIISFKRFTPDGKRKITNKIEFPINNLDLSKYINGYNSNTYKYDLFGICNHVGGVSGGHYTSFVKNAQQDWIHFNDEVIQRVEKPDIIVSNLAYCLFYRKKNNLI